MAEKEENFEGCIYHIWNRGVDGRLIVVDNNDRERFLNSLKLFNSSSETWIREQLSLCRKNPEMQFQEDEDRIKHLVGIIAYTLLDNHFHVALKELTEGGMTIFLRKLGVGYTKYFNKRHGRRGRLFETRTNYKPVEDDIYLQHLLAYIHLNILDQYTKNWRIGKLENWDKAKGELKSYRWSSACSYISKSNDHSLLDKKTINLLFENDVLNWHERYLRVWLKRGFANFVYSESY